VKPSDPLVELGRLRRGWLPAGRAIAWLAALVVLVWVFDRSVPVFVVAAGLIVALAIDALLAQRGLERPSLRVEAPPEVVAGAPVSYFVAGWAGRYPFLVAPLWIWPRTTIALDSEAAGLVTLPAPPRGVVVALPAELSTRGPLGCFQANRLVRVSLPTPVHAAPAPVEHEVGWPALRTIQFGPTETANVGHDLFRGIRPYVAGDPPRSVHWKATARHRQLMVRESEGTGVVVVRLVLDLPQGGSAAEDAIARLAHVAEEALRQHWLVRLVTVERIGAPPPPPPVDALRHGHPAPWPGPPPVLATVTRDVRTRRELQRRLAAAEIGRPAYGEQRVLTRIFRPAGDEWA
jgi:uncharacterized protein (DUF58 family)